MQAYEFTLAGAHLSALPSGALWWSEAGILCVSDLHFTRSGHRARRGTAPPPPGENKNTLARLERDILKRNPQMIICLGDSFDDLATFDEMDEAENRWLTCLMAGRSWVWIEGSHAPGPLDIGGTHVASFRAGPLRFRHTADADQSNEVSGNFHPKTVTRIKGRDVVRPCFLLDEQRVVLPAYGVFANGTRRDAPFLQKLMSPGSLAILTGKRAQPVPMKF